MIVSLVLLLVALAVEFTARQLSNSESVIIFTAVAAILAWNFIIALIMFANSANRNGIAIAAGVLFLPIIGMVIAYLELRKATTAALKNKLT